MESGGTNSGANAGIPIGVKLVMGLLMVTGVVTGAVYAVNYFKAKKELALKLKKPGTDPGPADQNPAPTPVKTASGKADYTGLPNGQTVYAVSPESRGTLQLGQDAKVRAGAVVQRLDESLVSQGSTTLAVDTDLGTIWHMGFPNTAIIRAKAGYAYPFYIVSYPDINAKVSIEDKVLAELSNIF